MPVSQTRSARRPAGRSRRGDHDRGPASRRLVVVRHGRTAWNAAGRFQGHADPPLDRIGWRQAWRAAAEVGVFHPVTVVASDLRRASQTARCIAAWSDVDVWLDPALREQEVGGWEGLTAPEAAEAFPDEYARWTAGLGSRRGGGETRDDAGARVAEALGRAVRACPPGRSIVVVSHGLALEAALGRVAGPGAAEHLGNGRWKVLPIRGDGW